MDKTKQADKDSPSPDNSIFTSLLAAQNLESQEYRPQYLTIMQTLKMLIENKRQSKIVDQLALADLDQELSLVDDGLTRPFNGCALIFGFVTQFAFKRWTVKFFYLTFLVHMRIHVAEPILCEYRLRYLAKQPTLIGQEVRNLYRFFYEQDDPDMIEMKRQCKLYLDTQNIRRDLHRKVI